MRISNVNIQHVLAPYLQKVGKTEVSSSGTLEAEAQAATGTDEVELSSLARAISAGAQAAHEAAAVRAAKIAALKARIEAGQYQVDSQKVAESIVDAMLDAAADAP